MADAAAIFIGGAETPQILFLCLAADPNAALVSQAAAVGPEDGRQLVRGILGPAPMNRRRRWSTTTS